MKTGSLSTLCIKTDNCTFVKCDQEIKETVLQSTMVLCFSGILEEKYHRLCITTNVTLNMAVLWWQYSHALMGCRMCVCVAVEESQCAAMCGHFSSFVMLICYTMHNT